MGRQESRSEATQARIIATAHRIFARDGFAKASLAEIVEQAEVTCRIDSYFSFTLPPVPCFSETK